MTADEEAAGLEPERREPCKCKWCVSYSPLLQKIEKIITPEDNIIFDEFINEVMSDSMDRNHYEAIFDGSWPNAEEILTNALKKVKLINKLKNMTKQEQISEDIKYAMKTKEEVALRVLRQLKNAITNAALISGNANNPVSDADVIVLIRKQVAQRQDSIKQFTEGKRLDLVINEENEMAILKQYLPAELSALQIGTLIHQAIEESGALTKKDMGRAIKRAIELSGGAVDNKVLSAQIGQLLN